MSWKYTDEYYKNYTRETWDECADKYLPLMEQLRMYHKVLLSEIEPRAGERVLDICTGPGEPAMTIAEMVAPDGHVVGVDLSKNMIEMATKTAAKRKLHNVEFLNMDAEKLELPENSFDLGLSCFGFQIVTNPDLAAAEILRVLKPGARAGFTVWSTGDRAPALDVIIGPMLEYAEPDETGYLPTPYELGGPGELVSMLTKTGFQNAKELRITGEWRAPSVDEYIKMVLEGSPLGHSLSEESLEVQKAVLEKARINTERFQTNDGVTIPAESVIALANKPSAKK